MNTTDIVWIRRSLEIRPSIFITSLKSMSAVRLIKMSLSPPPLHHIIVQKHPHFSILKRRHLLCSPTFTLLRYVSTAGFQLFTAPLRVVTCPFLQRYSSLYPPKTHIHSTTCSPKGSLCCAQQRLGDLLPCAPFNLLLVQPKLSVCVTYPSACLWNSCLKSLEYLLRSEDTAA